MNHCEDRRYDIRINREWRTVVSTNYQWPNELEPGTNYTVDIVAYCWFSTGYRKSSIFKGHLETLRK